MNVKQKNHWESIEIDRISGVSRKQFETKTMRFLSIERWQRQKGTKTKI